jgi:hypothetical protein
MIIKLVWEVKTYATVEVEVSDKTVNEIEDRLEGGYTRHEDEFSKYLSNLVNGEPTARLLSVTPNESAFCNRVIQLSSDTLSCGWRHSDFD